MLPEVNCTNATPESFISSVTSSRSVWVFTPCSLLGRLLSRIISCKEVHLSGGGVFDSVTRPPRLCPSREAICPVMRHASVAPARRATAHRRAASYARVVSTSVAPARSAIASKAMTCALKASGAALGSGG